MSGVQTAVVEPLAEGKHRVDLAEGALLAGLQGVHDAAAGAAAAVARRAEARDDALPREVDDHLLERAGVAEHELLLVDLLLAVARRVAADVDARAGVHLRAADAQAAVAQLLGLARGDDEPGVGHREAQHHHGLEEVVVGEGALRVGDLGAGGGVHARDGERVRADADEALELAGVRAHRGDLVLPVGLEAEEDAEADVVDARVERAVEAGDAPAEVALHGVGRVHLGVDLVVVGLLEDLERADAGLVDDLEVVDRHRRGVDVDAADLVLRARDASRHLGRVDGGEGVGDEARAGHRVLAVDGHHALVADLDHRLRLAPDLVHREAAALLLVVVEREAAVAAAVHAVARDVHRREGHDAVVVDLVLHVPGRLRHLGGVGTLEDVAAHVDAGSAVLDHIIGKRKRLGLGQLLAAGHHDGHRAGGHDFLEVVAIIGLDDLRAHLSDDAGSEFKVAVGALHILADSHNAQGRDAVGHAGVDDLGEVVDALELAVRADKGLDRHAVGIQTDRILDVDGDDLMAQIVVEHGGTGGHTQSNAALIRSGHTGAQRAAGAHEHVHIGHKCGDDKVQALETRSGAHEVAVIESEHDRLSGLGIKNVAQASLHAPAQAVCALDLEIALIGKGRADMIVFRNFQSVFICHFAFSFVFT